MKEMKERGKPYSLTKDLGRRRSFFPGQALFVNKKHQKSFWCFYKQGYQDSNLEMTESESVALPFGDSPSTDIDYT